MQKTTFTRRRSVKGQEVFTTGEVAKICKVTIRTVIKWFELGKLAGYKIPASKDRRIPRRNLLEFLKEHGIPYDPAIFDDKAKILIADDDPAVVKTLAALISDIDGVEVHTASSGYEAGFQTARIKPCLLLIDYDLGDTTADQVLDSLSRDNGLGETRVILMTGKLNDAEIENLETSGLRVMRKPIDVPALLGEIQAILRA